MEAVDDHHARLEREQRLTKLKRADKALAERKKALREVKAALRDCPFAQGPGLASWALDDPGHKGVRTHSADRDHHPPQGNPPRRRVG